MSVPGYNNMLDILSLLDGVRPEYSDWRCILLIVENRLSSDTVRLLTNLFSELSDRPDSSEMVSKVWNILNQFDVGDEDDNEDDNEDDDEDDVVEDGCYVCTSDEEDEEDEEVEDGCYVYTSDDKDEDENEEPERYKKPIETGNSDGCYVVAYDDDGNELPPLMYKHKADESLPQLTQNGWIFKLG